MQTKEAIESVLKEKALSKYALAPQMGCFPTSIHQWLRNTKMSEDYKVVFLKLYGIQIDDTL